MKILVAKATELKKKMLSIFKNLLVQNHKAKLSKFGIKLCLMDIYKTLQVKTSGSKLAPPWGSQVLHLYFYSVKFNSS